MLSQISFKLCK